MGRRKPVKKIQRKEQKRKKTRKDLGENSCTCGGGGEQSSERRGLRGRETKPRQPLEGGGAVTAAPGLKARVGVCGGGGAAEEVTSETSSMTSRITRDVLVEPQQQPQEETQPGRPPTSGGTKIQLDPLQN